MIDRFSLRVAGTACLIALLAGCQGPSEPGATVSKPAATAAGLVGSATTRLRADDDMEQVLQSLQGLGPQPIATLSAADARRQPTAADAVKALLTKEGKSTAPEPVASVRDQTIPGPGGRIPIRVYTPRGDGPFPVIVYYHGGGWVLADLDTYDSSARALANGARAVVVAADYRHAPENKFPAAHEDAYAAYSWVTRNTGSLRGDRQKIAVVGESAGGNLAANVALMARDRKITAPVHQVLIYPVAGTDMTTPSYSDSANALPLNKAGMVWFFDKYLRGPQDMQDPRIDLIHAPNLRGVAPATIINAGIDPLRSDGELYAGKLREAGVPVVQQTYAGVTHEFFGMGTVVAKAKEAEDLAASELRKAFAAAPQA